LALWGKTKEERKKKGNDKSQSAIEGTWGSSHDQTEAERGRERGEEAYVTRLRGSMRARCWRDVKRSLKRLPSGWSSREARNERSAKPFLSFFFPLSPWHKPTKTPQQEGKIKGKAHLDRPPTLRELIPKLDVHLPPELDALLPDFLTGETGEDLLLPGESTLGDELIPEVGRLSKLLLERGEDGDGLVEPFETEGFSSGGGLEERRGVKRREERERERERSWTGKDGEGV
jgi:hypothetical protein